LAKLTPLSPAGEVLKDSLFGHFTLEEESVDCWRAGKFFERYPIL
jgi:hypothetical protein